MFEFEMGNMFLEFEPDVEVCEGQLLIPLFAGEMIWGRARHTFMYFLALIYSFLGIAIAADVFMSAIEVITSQKRTITRIHPQTGDKTTVTFEVWNETVANLTLMALGSSAPEILLATIEFLASVRQEPEEGGLGPGTIVGSAAFNLLFIIAICIMSIPPNHHDGSPGSRKIKNFGVFLITAVFSLWAYVWLLIVLVVVTPDEVTAAEAFVTVLFFPLLVMLCYATEKGYLKYFCSADTAAETKPTSLVAQIGQAHLTTCTNSTGMGSKNHGGSKQAEPRAASSIEGATMGMGAGGGAEDATQDATQLSKRQFVGGNTGDNTSLGPTTERYAKLTDDTPAEQRLELAMEAVDSLMAGKKQSRMRYRIGASRMLAGRSKPVVAIKKPPRSMRKFPTLLRRRSSVAPTTGRKTIVGPVVEEQCVVEFQSSSYSILEGAGAITLTVKRTGDVLKKAVVGYVTRDGSARAGEDYEYTKGTLEFGVGEVDLTIAIPIVDDDVFEPDENFFVVLSKPKAAPQAGGGSAGGGAVSDAYELGSIHTAMVTIINDDCPGEFGLDQTTYSLCGGGANGRDSNGSSTSNGSSSSRGQTEVRIVRRNGCDGQVAVRYFSRDGTALAGRDYERVQGSVLFKHGEMLKVVQIRAAASHMYEEDMSFTFEVELPRYPSDGSKYIKGRKEAVVMVTNNPDFEKFMDEVTKLMEAKTEGMSVGTDSWRMQFVEAMRFDGGPEASNLMRGMHILTIGWKVS
jgi:solute carrier family 8 (sodium/calcium exchanger)